MDIVTLDSLIDTELKLKAVEAEFKKDFMKYLGIEDGLFYTQENLLKIEKNIYEGEASFLNTMYFYDKVKESTFITGFLSDAFYKIENRCYDWSLHLFTDDKKLSSFSQPFILNHFPKLSLFRLIHNFCKKSVIKYPKIKLVYNNKSSSSIIGTKTKEFEIKNADKVALKELFIELDNFMK